MVFLRIFFGLEFKGREAFPKSGPFLVAANHISHLDPIVVGIAYQKQLTFLAKEELFRNKILNWVLRDWGVVPLNRSKTDIKVLRTALEVLKTRPIAIFPQGTRTADLDAFNSGVGFLAHKAKVPVVAVKVSGTDKILPKGKKFFNFGKIQATIARVDTISPNDDYRQIAAKVMDKIKSM